ncbi:hypothetical protein HZB74_03565 [Candidatus Saccharibacteria bacterium]|nr:hypothetical protein [Candidatus Saccharibacteria bacterium]
MIFSLLSKFGALDPKNCEDADAFNPKDTPNCLSNLPEVAANSSNLKLGLGIVFGVAAGVALLSLVIAAINFATASTDFEKVARSKKAIIYSLIGLVVALSGEAIVLTLLDNI